MECLKCNCRIDLIVFGDQKNYSSTADWSNQTSLVFLSPVLLIRMNSLMADEKSCSWSDKEESPRCFHCYALVFSKACFLPNPPLISNHKLAFSFRAAEMHFVSLTT